MSVAPTTPVGQAATPIDPKLQDAALGFEELLVRQLAQSLSDTTDTTDTGSADGSDGSTDTGGSGGDATTSLLQSYLPDALAQSVKDAGGLGLAASIGQALVRRTS